MIKKNELLQAKENLNLGISGNLENLGRIYRRRADININLYLTEYVLEKKKSNYYNEAVEDYRKATELLKQANSGIHLSETLLAYGNALKEQFLPLHRKIKKFTECEKNAKSEYRRCFKRTLDINYLRYHFFTMLEQMNLEIRKKVWDTEDCLPKRLIIFHSLETPLSHKYLKGVYYFAYKHLIEVWEYNYGRVPDSDKNEHFILDRLLDASGVIFLCSPTYDKKAKPIVKFEIDKTKELINKNDPIKVFALDINNKEVIDELKPFSVIANENQFENRFQDFLKKKDLKDIYHCREYRCKNDP